MRLILILLLLGLIGAFEEDKGLRQSVDWKAGNEVHPTTQGQQDTPRVVPVDAETARAQMGAQMAKAWEMIGKRAKDTIQDSERDEVNPWLERTQWLPYLVSKLPRCWQPR